MEINEMAISGDDGGLLDFVTDQHDGINAQNQGD